MSIKMQIAVVVNPRSGRGTAKAAAQTLQDELGKRGHVVHVVETGANTQIDQAELQSQIADSDRVVIIGGDGTVHHMLPILTQVETPMYHLGTGTANLICKEFGMSQSAMTVVGHLETDLTPTVVDVPNCNGVPFLIMVSLGIDASVIHRLEETRKLKAGYRAYFSPILSEIVSPRPANFQVQCTNDTAHPPYQETGILVIANLRSYGGRFNPCPDANPCDGLLDAVAFPCKTSIGSGVGFGLFRVGLTPKRAKRFVQESLTITSTHGSVYVQVDGEQASFVAGLKDGRLEPGTTLQIAMNGQHIRLHAPETM